MFWDWFESVSNLLGVRANTFRAMLEHVDKFDGPITIVETGCMRTKDSWQDGCSTLIFDQYVTSRNDGSGVISVDNSQAAVDACRELVSDQVQVLCLDSVVFLYHFTQKAKHQSLSVPLFYLDSFDLDWAYWQPSAIHHLKELAAIAHFLDSETLVVVDDCAQFQHFVRSPEQTRTIDNAAGIGGKGRLIAEYAHSIGAELVFSEYQAGWKGFNSNN